MPFFLEIPEEHAHVKLTRVELPAPSFQHQKEYFLQYCREYCQVLEAIVVGEKIEFVQPRKILSYTWGYRNSFFEVEGPSRIISIKEFVSLYNQSRALRKLPPFQWDESVAACIRTFEEYEAEEEKK